MYNTPVAWTVKYTNLIYNWSTVVSRNTDLSSRRPPAQVLQWSGSEAACSWGPLLQREHHTVWILLHFGHEVLQVPAHLRYTTTPALSLTERSQQQNLLINFLSKNLKSYKPSTMTRSMREWNFISQYTGWQNIKSTQSRAKDVLIDSNATCSNRFVL